MIVLIGKTRLRTLPKIMKISPREIEVLKTGIKRALYKIL